MTRICGYEHRVSSHFFFSCTHFLITVPTFQRNVLPLSPGRDSNTFVNCYKGHVITLHRTVIFTVTHCGNIRSHYVKASLLNKATWAWNPKGRTQHATNTIITKQCQFGARNCVCVSIPDALQLSVVTTPLQKVQQLDRKPLPLHARDYFMPSSKFMSICDVTSVSIVGYNRMQNPLYFIGLLNCNREWRNKFNPYPANVENMVSS